MIQPAGAALVVTAQSFNPSIFSQVWLVREVGVDEKCFTGTTVVSPQAAQHELGNMQILVIPARLQVTVKPGDDDAASAAAELVTKVVEKLPHTPFQAVGMNFDYLLMFASTEEFVAKDRALFLTQTTPLKGFFDQPDARYGGYYSRNVGDVRLKLDIKPRDPSGEVGIGEHLMLNFNFHLALSNGADRPSWQRVADTLGRWAEFRDLTKQLLADIESSVPEEQNA